MPSYEQIESLMFLAETWMDGYGMDERAAFVKVGLAVPPVAPETVGVQSRAAGPSRLSRYIPVVGWYGTRADMRQNRFAKRVARRARRRLDGERSV